MLISLNMRLLEHPAPGPAGIEPAIPIAPVLKRPRKPHGPVPWLLVAILVTAIGFGLRYGGEIAVRLRPALPAASPTIEVRSGIIEQAIRLTGSTVAENSVFLRAPYLRGRRSTGPGDFGLVLEELAAPGSEVRKNDPVAVFERTAMLRRLDRYRAARVESEFRLKTMRADLAVRLAAYQQQVRVAKARMEQAALDLKTAPIRSAIQAEKFRLDFNEAKATYEALLARTRYVEAADRAGIRIAELELQEARVGERRAEANVQRMVVRAPVDGLLVVREIRRGTELGQIQAGDQLHRGQAYAQIVDPSSLVVEAKANQVDVEHLRIGSRAEVRLEAYDLELPARVYSIGAMAKRSGWRGRYVAEVPVFLKLDRVDPHLIPNLSVSADVILRSVRSDGIVPREAIFHDEESGQPFAYVQTAGGWEKRHLELGVANEVDVSVRSGLKPGEEVAVSEPNA